jgi:uncharacterized SAM-binding protein YcdF (DUF218 family)
VAKKEQSRSALQTECFLISPKMNIYALLSYFAQPSVLIYSALGVALLRAWWVKPELRRALRGAVCFYLLFVAISLPATQHAVLRMLERQYPPSNSSIPTADAIVVLSGDVLQPDGLRTEAEPGPRTFYRCLHAADLYSRKPCPVIVSGATSDPDGEETGCAVVMRELLIKLGVKPADLIVENGSFSTYENAVACKKIMDEKSFQTAVLVTDATHLPRAVRCFQSAGAKIIPSGCMYRSSRPSADYTEFVPRVDAAQWVDRACHEWQGIAWYWLRGRI